MGWNGSLTGSSAIGSAITFTPDTSAEGAYTVAPFTAPKKGVYRFRLYGSGGTNWGAGSANIANSGNARYGGYNGKAGGYTDGYLLLEKGQTVYVGAGGTCSAAFVAKATGSKLSAIAKANLFFVAGGGGAGCSYWDVYQGGNNKMTAGTVGGGTSGGAAPGTVDTQALPGRPGTQTAGGKQGSYGGESRDNAGSYGTGGASFTSPASRYNAYSGRGGDGLYGGGGGFAEAYDNGTTAGGGGGGSGYVYAATLTVYKDTYTSTTSQGGGSAANANGKVIVSYHARADLPVFFDLVRLTQIFFNGVEAQSLVYNGTRLFMRRSMTAGSI